MIKMGSTARPSHLRHRPSGICSPRLLTPPALAQSMSDVAVCPSPKQATASLHAVWPLCLTICSLCHSAVLVAPLSSQPPVMISTATPHVYSCSAPRRLLRVAGVAHFPPASFY